MGVENNIPEGWVESTLNELAFINPRESIRKGDLAKNVPMDCIDSFTRKISRFGIKEFKGGTKFKNKDTLLATDVVNTRPVISPGYQVTRFVVCYCGVF